MIPEWVGGRGQERLGPLTAGDECNSSRARCEPGGEWSGAGVRTRAGEIVGRETFGDEGVREGEMVRRGCGVN